MIHLSPEFWLQSAVSIIGGVCAVIAVAYRIGLLEAKYSTKVELKEKVQERQTQVEKIYQRMSDEYVRKDMCGQLHVSTKEEVKRVDDDNKTFRHEIRNTVQKIFDTIEVQNEKIGELKDLFLKR